VFYNGFGLCSLYIDLCLATCRKQISLIWLQLQPTIRPRPFRRHLRKRSKTGWIRIASKCSPTHAVSYCIAYGVCFAFSAIVNLSHTLHNKEPETSTKWKLACGSFALASISGVLLIYYLVLFFSFLLNYFLVYICTAITLGSILLVAAGTMVMYFKWEPHIPESGSYIACSKAMSMFSIWCSVHYRRAEYGKVRCACANYV